MISLYEEVRSFHKARKDATNDKVEVVHAFLRNEFGTRFRVSDPVHEGFGKYQFDVSIQVEENPVFDLQFSIIYNGHLRFSPHGGDVSFPDDVNSIAAHVRDYIKWRLTGTTEKGFTEDKD